MFFVILMEKTFAQIDFVKRNILSLYEEDLAKYDNENREKASVVYNMLQEQLERRANFMTDFELLSIVLMILGIVVSILIAYIDHTKKVTAPAKETVTF